MLQPTTSLVIHVYVYLDPNLCENSHPTPTNLCKITICVASIPWISLWSRVVEINKHINMNWAYIYIYKYFKKKVWKKIDAALCWWYLMISDIFPLSKVNLQGSQQGAPQPLRKGAAPDEGAQLRIAVAQQRAVVDVGRTHLKTWRFVWLGKGFFFIFDGNFNASNMGKSWEWWNEIFWGKIDRVFDH